MGYSVARYPENLLPAQHLGLRLSLGIIIGCMCHCLPPGFTFISFALRLSDANAPCTDHWSKKNLVTASDLYLCLNIGVTQVLTYKIKCANTKIRKHTWLMRWSAVHHPSAFLPGYMILWASWCLSCSIVGNCKSALICIYQYIIQRANHKGECGIRTSSSVRFNCPISSIMKSDTWIALPCPFSSKAFCHS